MLGLAEVSSNLRKWDLSEIPRGPRMVYTATSVFQSWDYCCLWLAIYKASAQCPVGNHVETWRVRFRAGVWYLG